MTAVTYTAERSLTTGHSQSQQYSIRIRARSIEHGKDTNRKEQVALGGASESLLWRNKRTFSVTTAALVGGELSVTREFLDSVNGGEQFTFDEFGLPDSPNNPVTVVLVGVYREARAVPQGDGGADDYFRLSFTAREV